MKQQGRSKAIRVKYKGYTLVQNPWKSFYDDRKHYAKYLFDENDKLVLRASFGSYCSRKKLRLLIRSYVDKLLPMLMSDKRIGEESEEK